MADEIEIVNVGGENGVASEVTLERLVKAVERMAKSKGLDPKEAAAKLKELSDEIDDTIDVVSETRDSLEDFTDTVKDADSSVGRLGNSMLSLALNGIGSLAGGVFNLGQELIMGGNRLSDFSQHIPIVGSYLTEFAAYLDGTFETFRDLSSSGASFNNSMQDLMRSAAGARMGIDEFGALVLRNTEQLAAYGGTVTQGAKQVATLNQALGRHREDLLNMGFTYEDINENLINYAFLTRQQGRIESRNAAEVAANAAEYAQTLQTLSKLTGEDVDAIRDRQQAQMNDFAFQQMLVGKSETEQARIATLMAEAELAGPAAVNRLKEILLGLPPLTDETRAFVIASRGANESLERSAALISDTTLSQDQFSRAINSNTAEMLAGMIEGANDMQTVLAVASRTGDGFGAQVLQNLQAAGVDLAKYLGMTGQELEDAISADLQAAQEEANRRGELTQSMAAFNERITEARRTIQEQFINSGIYDMAADAVGMFAEVLGSPEVISAFKTGIDILREFIDGFRQDPMAALGDALRNIGDALIDYLFGTTQADNVQEQQEDLTRVDNRIAELQQQIQETSRNRSPEAVAQVQALREELARTQERRADIESRDTSATEGAIPSIMPSIGEGISALFTSPTTYGVLGGAILTLFAANAVKNALVSGVSNLLGGAGRGAGRGAGAAGVGVGRGIAGLGRGMGVGLRGLAAGAASLANPLTLVGLGAFTLAVNGIALAVRVAAPGIEAFGSAIRDVLEGVTPIVQEFSPIIESLGEALRNAFSGVAEIITSFAAPIEAALGGISSVVESAGTAIESALNGVASVAESVGNAISAPITAAGDAIQGVIDSINEYRTAGIEATTNQIERLANIPGNNLVDAARGIEMMKAALEGFEPGFWEGLGDWFTGGARQDSMIATTTVIQDMARAFADLDPEAVERASTSVASLSTALQTFNSATAIEGVGDLASRLLGYEDAASAIVTLATSLENINGENLTNVAPGIVAISSAVGEFQSLTSISNVGEGISAALNSYKPLAETVVDVANSLSTIETPENLTAAASGVSDVATAIGEFQTLTSISSVGEGVSAALESYKPLAETVVDVATSLSAIETPENLATISPALTSIITAIDSFQSLTSISSLGEGVSTVLNSYSAVTTPLIELINSLAPIDGTQLQNVAPGIEAVSNALTVFKNSTGFQGLGDLVANWFSDDAMEVGANIKAIADDLSAINAVQLTSVSTAIVAMSNAFEAFSEAEIDNVNLNRNFVTRVQSLANSAAGLERTNTALASIASIEGLSTELNAIQESLNAEGVNAYADAMERLVEVLGDLNDELTRDNNGLLRAGTGTNAGTVVNQTTSRPTGSQTVNEEQLNQLNSTMEQVAELLAEISENTRRTTRATERMGTVY